jgi:lactoylglutathione lyase
MTIVEFLQSTDRFAWRRLLWVPVLAFGMSISVANSADDAPTPAGTSLRSVGICVSDLERSLAFYTKAFGFSISPRTLRANAAFASLLELDNVDATIRFVDTGGVMLELFQYANPKAIGNAGTRQPMNHIGLTNLQFKVSDLAATLKAVKQAGGTVLENARIAGPDGVTRAIFVLDPDGTRIELVPG